MSDIRERPVQFAICAGCGESVSGMIDPCPKCGDWTQRVERSEVLPTGQAWTYQPATSCEVIEIRIAPWSLKGGPIYVGVTYPFKPESPGGDDDDGELRVP